VLGAPTFARELLAGLHEAIAITLLITFAGLIIVIAVHLGHDANAVLTCIVTLMIVMLA
jgi:hypothetical protein